MEWEFLIVFFCSDGVNELMFNEIEIDKEDLLLFCLSPAPLNLTKERCMGGREEARSARRRDHESSTHAKPMGDQTGPAKL